MNDMLPSLNALARYLVWMFVAMMIVGAMTGVIPGGKPGGKEEPARVRAFVGWTAACAIFYLSIRLIIA